MGKILTLDPQIPDLGREVAFFLSVKILITRDCMADRSFQRGIDAKNRVIIIFKLFGEL